MENTFLEFVKLVNPAQLIVIGLIIFFFYNRLDCKLTEYKKDTDTKIDEIKIDTGNKFDKLEARLDKLEDKQDDNFKILLTRIDTINSRLDSLYHELFKKDRKDAA